MANNEYWQGYGWYKVSYYDQTEQPFACWFDLEDDLKEEIAWAHKQCREVDYVDCEFLGDGILPSTCESMDPYEGDAIDSDYVEEDVFRIWELSGAIKSDGLTRDRVAMHDAFCDADCWSISISELYDTLNKIYDKMEARDDA